MIQNIRHAVVGAVLLATGVACAQQAPQTPELTEKWKDKNMYSIQAKALDGSAMDLSQFKGKVVVVVNVASRCGYTPQYAGLQKLYDDMKGKDVVVLGVPCNDFGGQEPGSAQEIASFCSKNYGVTFPITEKSQSAAGKGQSALYEFLGTRTGKLPGWNFCKYVVGRDGQPVQFFASSTKPDSAELRACIEKALEAKTSTEKSAADQVPVGKS
jgi:glutathione peroxidase